MMNEGTKRIHLQRANNIKQDSKQHACMHVHSGSRRIIATGAKEPGSTLVNNAQSTYTY